MESTSDLRINMNFYCTDNFGSKLKDLMEKKNLNQHQLAVKAGVSDPMISHYIQGIKLPRVSIFVKLLNALEVPPETFITTKDKTNA